MRPTGRQTHTLKRNFSYLRFSSLETNHLFDDRFIMAYDEKLANLTRELISLTPKKVEEKKMFGGLCFMVNDKMCLGVEQDCLMVRLDPSIMDEAMRQDGCKPMDFTGKVMKGFVFVDKEVLRTKKQVGYWVALALDFNKKAKTSKKKSRQCRFVSIEEF